VLPCHYDLHWLNNTFMFFGLCTYLNAWRYTVFSTDDSGGVKNFKYVFSGFLCCVSGLINLEFMLLFMVFHLWIGPGFIFVFCS
jgi:hypothetical protein